MKKYRDNWKSQSERLKQGWGRQGWRISQRRPNRQSLLVSSNLVLESSPLPKKKSNNFFFRFFLANTISAFEATCWASWTRQILSNIEPNVYSEKQNDTKTIKITKFSSDIFQYSKNLSFLNTWLLRGKGNCNLCCNDACGLESKTLSISWLFMPQLGYYYYFFFISFFIIFKRRFHAPKPDLFVSTSSVTGLTDPMHTFMVNDWIFEILW